MRLSCPELEYCLCPTVMVQLIVSGILYCQWNKATFSDLHIVKAVQILFIKELLHDHGQRFGQKLLKWF